MNKVIVKAKDNDDLRSSIEFAEFYGFKISYPECLYGVIPPKEYIGAIEFINANSIRDKLVLGDSTLVFIISMLLLFIPHIFILSSDYRKRTKYLKDIEDGIKPAIEQINNTLGVARGVTFNYKMARNVKEIKLIISYPQSQAIQLPISNSLLATDNTHILLLNDSGYQRYQYSQTYHYWTENFNNSMKPIYVRTGWISVGSVSTKKYQYPPQLYNYISSDELFAVLKEYEEFRGPKAPDHSTLETIAIITSAIVVGLFLILYLFYGFKDEEDQYYQDYFNSIESLMNQFNQRFSQRGIIFKAYRLKQRGAHKPDLVIYIPKEQNDMAQLITTEPSNYPMVVSSLNGNFLPLFQVNQPILFNALPQPSVIKISK
ncbi:hypothetical protein ACTFIZ_012188 [Dictyostelium cf. discoideum]